MTRAPWRHPACQSAADTIAKALRGTWRDARVCMLPHALALGDADPPPSAACDAQLDRQVAAMTPRCESEAPPTP
jgi:hypothetical protein